MENNMRGSVRLGQVRRRKPPYRVVRKDNPAAPLNERERQILRLVVESFIDTAGPVGSHFLARRYPIGLSPASIRNTMSDLEEMGYLDHPYTSAGRVPTDLGYRTFVDALMDVPELAPDERRLLQQKVREIGNDPEELWRESTRLLGQLSRLLGVVLTPRLSTGVLERLEVVPLSSTRAMFVLSVRGGLVRTILVELTSELSRRDLELVVALLNERLAGLTLAAIRQSCHQRLRDLEDRTGLVQLVLDEAPTLFSEPSEGRVRFGGTQYIMGQPEFQRPEELRNLFLLLEDEEELVRLLEGTDTSDDVEVGRAQVSIGRENQDEKVERFSIVTARYRLGDAVGTIGVIGPTRMDYRRVLALVQEMARLLSRPIDETVN
ncbi:heat-inducible transcription repressor HrcA [Rhodothermus marinus]|nr:heat-inducible transcription repressor HrcA [Rhodothermus marinus]